MFTGETEAPSESLTGPIVYVFRAKTCNYGRTDVNSCNTDQQHKI